MHRTALLIALSLASNCATGCGPTLAIACLATGSRNCGDAIALGFQADMAVGSAIASSAVETSQQRHEERARRQASIAQSPVLAARQSELQREYKLARNRQFAETEGQVFVPYSGGEAEMLIVQEPILSGDSNSEPPETPTVILQ